MNKKFEMIKLIVYKLSFSVVLLLAVVACSSDSNERWLKIEEGEVDAVISVNGELESADSLQIGPPMTKNVWQYSITLLAPEGKQVKPGDMVIAFDDKELKNKLENKKNEVTTAKKNLENTVLQDIQREKDLRLRLEEYRMKVEKAERKAVQSEGSVASRELDKLRIDLHMANNNLALGEDRIRLHVENSKIRKQLYNKQIDRLEAEMEEIENSIKKMTVASDQEGIVVYRTKHSGEKYDVGSRVFMSDKAVEVANLTNMVVKAEIPESDAGKVSVGQKVKIVLDASPDTPFVGEIKSLGKIFRRKSYNQPAIVFDAVVSIDNPDTSLMRPGMAARLDIVYASFDKAYELPVNALSFDSEGAYVNVRSVLGPSVQRVKLGAVGVQYAVVTEGLSDGLEVKLL